MIEKQFGIVIYPLWRENRWAYNPEGTVRGVDFVLGAAKKALNPTDQNKTRYIHDVRAELQRIVRSRAGRALASALLYHSNRVAGAAKGEAITVMPYEEDSCNAKEVRTSVGSTLPVVLFSPGTRASYCGPGKAESLPHETLHHELVHALRRISGAMLHPFALAGQLRPYDDNEEFLAILATDIFISDVTNHHKSLLRANHQGFKQLDPELADSFRFFSLGLRAFNIIANFCSDNPAYTTALANVQGPFNPIAAYYKNRKKAFDVAAKGDAEDYFNNSLIPLDFYRLPGGNWTRTNPDRGVPGKAAGAGQR
jgi:hypothetical protein